jgi:hypothetical protein
VGSRGVLIPVWNTRATPPCPRTSLRSINLYRAQEQLGLILGPAKAYERLLKADVKYRFSIDMASQV